MAIRSGIGIGEAQVFDTRGIVNTYAKLIQQQQAEQAKYQKELADAISKVDLKNLDPTDSKYILDQYGSVKDLYGKLASIKDKTQQRLAISQIQKSMDEINEYANGARNYRANLVKVADTMNNNPYDYDPESKDEVAKLVNLPYAEAIKLGKSSINPMTYRRIPDVSMVDKSMDEMRKMLEATSKDMGAFTVEKAKQPGWTVPVYKSSADDFTKLMAMELAANGKLRFQYKELYNQMNPGAKQPNELELADFAKSMYEKKYGNASYRFAGEAKPPKEAKSDKLTNDEAWEELMKSAFSGNKSKAVADINAIAGEFKARIVPNKDGKTYTVFYKPTVNVGGGGVPVYMPSPIEEKRVVRNPGELYGILRSAGVTGSGAASMKRLGGAGFSQLPPSR